MPRGKASTRTADNKHAQESEHDDDDDDDADEEDSVEEDEDDGEGDNDSDDDEEDGEESEEEEELDIDECGRVTVGGHVDYTTRCFDGAVVYPATDAKALCADCVSVFTARATGEGEALSVGSTFWTPAVAKPTTALERLAQEIFEFHTQGAEFDAARSGAEWWTQTIAPADDIGLHWDRDYDMEVDQGLLLHPHVATVTYLSAPREAAPTLILDRPSPFLADESPCGPLGGAAVCWPTTGRHLCFDGRKLHGAMAELASLDGRCAESSEPPPTSKRITFLGALRRPDKRERGGEREWPCESRARTAPVPRACSRLHTFHAKTEPTHVFANSVCGGWLLQ